MGADFRPTRDSLAPPVFDTPPRCSEATLGAPIFHEPGYDQRGLTNSLPGRFAHLSVLYVRVFDAYVFVRDGLRKGSFAPVRVNGWDSFGSLAYSCGSHAILVSASRADVFDRRRSSAVFAMRHEYGHHFMCASPIAGDDALPLYAPGDTPHRGLENSDSADAWTEGFACWFAAAVAEDRGESRPWVQLTAAGRLDMLYGGAQLDDPFTAGEQPTYGQLAEEFSVASLLWQVSDVTGSALLLDALEAAPVDLANFNRVYTTLGTDVSISSFFDTLPCDFPDTGTNAFGLDCLSIDTGFYHDLDADGRYGPDAGAGGNEIVGSTRWPLALRDETIFRPNTPALDGSLVRLGVEDGQGAPVAVEAFRVEVEYDPPLAAESGDYLEPVSGDGPWEIAILVPGGPSRARITPVTADPEPPEPLVIESAFFHERIDPFRAGGVSPILAEHVFVVPEAAAPASALEALLVVGVLRRRVGPR